MYCSGLKIFLPPFILYPSRSGNSMRSFVPFLLYCSPQLPFFSKLASLWSPLTQELSLKNLHSLSFFVYWHLPFNSISFLSHSIFICSRMYFSESNPLGGFHHFYRVGLWKNGGLAQLQVYFSHALTALCRRWCDQSWLCEPSKLAGILEGGPQCTMRNYQLAFEEQCD